MTITLTTAQIAGLIITGLAIFGTHYFRYWRKLGKLAAYAIGLSCILAGLGFTAVFGANAFTFQEVFAYCAIAGIVTILTNEYDNGRKAQVRAAAAEGQDAATE